MRAKAEGVVGSLLKLIPGVKRIEFPNPNLPFDKRWELASNLPADGQVVFVSREISALLFSIEIRRGLSFPHQLVEQSSLPVEVKRYILGTPLFIDFVDKDNWDRELLLLLTSNKNEFFIEFSRYSQTKTGNPLRLGLTISGEKRGSKDNITTLIEEAWRFKMPGSALQQTGAYKLYQNLHDFIEREGSFVVTKELVRFAHDVLSARAQPPPAPAAA